jgi:hypothetical protein
VSDKQVVVSLLLLLAVLLLLRPREVEEPGLWSQEPTPTPTPVALVAVSPAPTCSPVRWRPGYRELSLVLPVSC